jgi:hypothetical protein
MEPCDDEDQHHHHHHHHHLHVGAEAAGLSLCFLHDRRIPSLFSSSQAHCVCQPHFKRTDNDLASYYKHLLIPQHSETDLPTHPHPPPRASVFQYFSISVFQYFNGRAIEPSLSEGYEHPGTSRLYQCKLIKLINAPRSSAHQVRSVSKLKQQHDHQAAKLSCRRAMSSLCEARLFRCALVLAS